MLKAGCFQQGESTLGFNALSSLAEAFEKHLDFESVQKEVIEVNSTGLGILSGLNDFRYVR